MAYRFEPDESVRRAIFRCAQEQLDHAIAELSEEIEADPGHAIHSARKAIKKERSLLRLARGAMPAGQRRRETAALREAARSVSGARDAEVIAVRPYAVTPRTSTGCRTCWVMTTTSGCSASS